MRFKEWLEQQKQLEEAALPIKSIEKSVKKKPKLRWSAYRELVRKKP